ncbi:riboflavin synthase subunit alpha [Rheinheimera sp. D18]|uniref:riboflavin synthase subunit alpha n=1 Tax=Rheinheimera sp. D18 TaxID=2545632 RepID=UPI0010504ECF|nr:riboflavin synthase subunit alpha [Rheinheimera sp. D18]QBL09640.1 riboflavin synthase subunit alpha [Rheinheimera sp. D18]
MFTGIVQTTAVITEIRDEVGFRQLRLQPGSAFLQKLNRGASIAINGVCLTVTDFDALLGWVCFDVIEETLRKTNLGQLKTGQQVNFERSLTFGSELGGHIVSGHIQTTALITQIDKSSNNCAMRLKLSPDDMRYILSKGFVAVEGCSLTVGETDSDGFSLYLIPETLSITTLGQKQVGDSLNIEWDQQTQTIVQTVERIMAARFA